MSREISHGIKAREALIIGIEKVAAVVAGTLGPRGRNTILDKREVGGTCIVTNDGVSIARSIELVDPSQNQGARLLVEVASTTNDMVGDGTTTSMVLARAMVLEGMKSLAAGANPIVLRKGMKKATDIVLEELANMAIPVKNLEDIARVAAISAGDEEVGNMLATIMKEITPQGFITLENSNTMKTEIEVVKGMRLKAGYMSRYMCTDKTQKQIILENPYLLITDQAINNIQMILPILEKVTKENRSLLILAPDITGDAITTIILNTVKGNFKVVGVKAPGFGQMQKDILEDLAVATGGVCMANEKGDSLTDMTLAMLGNARRVQIDSTNTVVSKMCGKEEKIQNRVNAIRKQLDQTESEFDKERYIERISKLMNGIGVIKVGADTEIEMIEMKLRIEDAISSAKAAVEQGICIGGGASYVHASKILDSLIHILEGDEKQGAKIIKKALEAPLCQIVTNGGMDAIVVVEKVKEMEPPYGYDVIHNCYVDMLVTGIIEAKKVTSTALINATSMVSTLLTTESLTTVIPGTEAQLSSMPQG